MERGWLLLGVWSILLFAEALALEAVQSSQLGDGDRAKRARMVMFGKRDDDVQAGEADKRPFGWGSYKWSPQDSQEDGLAGEDGSKRAFGSVMGNGFGGKRARTFSFGKRGGDDGYGSWDEQLAEEKRAGGAGDEELDLKALLNAYGNQEKRGRMVMFGKRPFGSGIHRWDSAGFGSLDNGDNSFMSEDEKRAHNKRIFKFGKRTV